MESKETPVLYRGRIFLNVKDRTVHWQLSHRPDAFILCIPGYQT